MQRDVTVVIQRAQAQIDGNAWNAATSIGHAAIARFVPDAVRLESGARELLSRTKGQEGLHYGIIDPSGSLVSFGSMLAHGSVETVAIGRHSHSDLRGAEGDFALRHALLVRRPERSDELFVFDLSSTQGTQDLQGQPIGAATFELPCALRLGSQLLIAFSSEQAGLGALGLAELSGASLMRLNAASSVAAKFVYTLEDLSSREPLAASPAPAVHGSETMPALVATVPPVPQVTFRPNETALARGFVIGRYERCGAPGFMGWEDQLSRVHALLFSIGDAAYIADLASTNGTRHDALGYVRLKHLCAGDRLWLGNSRLSVEACD